MKLNDLDRPEYRDIELYTMDMNGVGYSLPVFFRRYSMKAASSPVHRHEMVQINYINRGTLYHEISGSRNKLVKGDIFVVPPYVPHQLQADGDNAFEAVELEFMPEFILSGISMFDDIGSYSSFIEFSYIEPFLVSEMNIRPRLNLAGEKQHTIEGLLSEFESEFTQREDGYLLALRAVLLRILVLLGRYFRQDIEKSDMAQIFARHRDAVGKAIEYIDSHYDEVLFIEDIARIAMLSPSYCSYLFKAVTGQTIIEYLKTLRIGKAMERLKETEDLVLEISLDTGFRNVTHFNRTFKEVVGVSPTQYRKANRRPAGESPE